MRTTIILFLLALSLAGYAQSPQTYEYLTMVQYVNEIKLTVGSEKFEIIKVKEEKSSDYEDFRPLLKRVEEYEKQGWEMVHNVVYPYSQHAVPKNYVLMRRKK